MIDDIKQDAIQRMDKSVEALRKEMGKLRTGRAHVGLLDHITVPYYGTDTPLNQVAGITVSDARTLTVTPWEKKLIPDIEKAILSAGLGLNPVTSADIVRIPLPALTGERRQEMTKMVRQEAEQTKVAIRNIRRDANQHLKALIKDEHLAKDEEHRAEETVQKITDEHIARVDGVLAEKERELMEF